MYSFISEAKFYERFHSRSFENNFNLNWERNYQAWQQRFSKTEEITFCVSDRVPSRNENRANLPSQEETEVWCAFVETRTRTKKKATFYLQNRWNEWKRSVEGEKLHTRSDSFLSNFYRARDVRSQREGYVTHQTIRTFSSLPRPRTARHRSGVNTLTVASQFSIVFFFFSTTIFDIFTRLLNTVPSIH